MEFLLKFETKKNKAVKRSKMIQVQLKNITNYNPLKINLLINFKIYHIVPGRRGLSINDEIFR